MPIFGANICEDEKSSDVVPQQAEVPLAKQLIFEYNTHMVGSRSALLSLSPQVLRWARKRARLEPQELAEKLKVAPDRVAAWEKQGQIGMPQVIKLAKQTLTPLGYFFMPKPPSDSIPVADFRTVASAELENASAELNATMMNMMRRQDWLREYAIELREPLDFVSSYDANSFTPEQVADGMRSVLGLSRGWQEDMIYSGARGELFDHIEDSGILPVINGVVDNNTHRPLDPSEFRGFALVDEYAPLVFVNGNDAISAQMFTLAHECAHIFIGKSGVSLCDHMQPAQGIEMFCNAAAAEFLVPASKFTATVLSDGQGETFIADAAKRYCVSKPVIAYRAHDLAMLSTKGLHEFMRKHEQDLAQAGRPPYKGGGNFWFNQKYRIGHSFGDTVVSAVLAGKLPYREAWYLTGLSGRSFDKYVEQRRKIW